MFCELGTTIHTTKSIEQRKTYLLALVVTSMVRVAKSSVDLDSSKYLTSGLMQQMHAIRAFLFLRDVFRGLRNPPRCVLCFFAAIIQFTFATRTYPDRDGFKMRVSLLSL